MVLKAATSLGVLIGLLLVAAGCVSEPPKRIVDFSSVQATQPGASFQLEVKVVGIENGTVPLAGAFVGVAVDETAIAKATTGNDGVAVLNIKKGQTITIVAKAEGWTTEDSGEIRIGASSSSSTSVSSCFFFWGTSGCVVTASNATHVHQLDGDQGRVTVVLFRNVVQQTLSIPVGPHAYTPVTTLPDGKRWFTKTQPLSEEAAFHDLYMLRLVSLDASIQWRNFLAEQGDFGFGVGCSAASPQIRSQETVPYLTRQMSDITLRLTWAPSKSNYWWSPCEDVYMGPLVETVSSQVTVKGSLTLRFEGRSSIVPIEG